MHPPNNIRSQTVRQGPFLLQPAPQVLEGSEGGDATDIVYLAFGQDDDPDDHETERLGIVLVTYQDGKVDVFLDVEKVEARWERKVDYSYDNARSPYADVRRMISVPKASYPCLRFTRQSTLA